MPLTGAHQAVYRIGFDDGVASHEEPSREEIDGMLKELRDNLANYEIIVEGDWVNFKSVAEEFENEYPLKVLLAMYQEGAIQSMFLMPGTIPH
jgi:hypothetical protein